MTKKINVTKLLKDAGFIRQQALPGIKTYDPYRTTSFYGSQAAMRAFKKAAEEAGLIFFQPTYTVKGALRADLEDKKHLTTFEGWVTIYTPKKHKTYSGSLYD